MFAVTDLKDNKTYLRVYFRVEAGYIWGEGMPSENRDRFCQEVREILSGIGFSISAPRISGGCPEAQRGGEYLYCHPMELSGYVAENSIEEIKPLLSSAKTFKLRKADVYDTSYNFTEDEFRAALKAEREKIEDLILARFRTPRRNLYHSPSLLFEVKSDLPFFREGIQSIEMKAIEMKAIERGFVSRVFDDLVNRGHIIKARSKNDVTIFRTRTAKDGPVRVSDFS